MLTYYIHRLQQYLSYRYIIDDFDDSIKRISWLIGISRNLGKEYKDFFQKKNSYHSNLIENVLNVVTLLKKHYIGTNPRFQGQVGKLLQYSSGAYDHLPKKEKVPYMKDFKQEAFTLLQTLT